MKHILRAVSAAAVLAGATVWAQPGGRGGPPGMSASIAKLFGGNKTFSANVVTTMKSSSDSDAPMTMEVKMFMLDGKIRQDMDMGKMPGVTASRAAQMKQMGMDKTMNIIRPDKKAMYRVFPGLSAYVEITMSDKDVADAMDNSKIEKMSLGKETVDGHPCEKNKVTITSDNGEQHVIIVWNATDLKEFPIQMQIDDSGSSIVMKYTNIKFEKPDAKLFDPPAEFTKYNSQQALMQGEMMKRAGGGGFGGPPK